ncbi:MAG: helix-turn-helix domain-containing protein [Pseudomonadota bacterium]
MEDLNAVFRLLTASQIILLTGYCLLYERHRAGLLVAACTIGFICYLLLPISSHLLPEWLRIFPIILATAIPSLLWLLARWFFYDEHELPVWLLLLTVAYLILWLLPDAQQVQLIAHTDTRLLLFSLLPQFIKLMLAVHVIYMAIEGHSADLVDQRRKLRVLLAIGAGSLVSVVIIVEIWSRGPAPPVLEVLGMFIMFILSLTANLYLMGLRSELNLKPLTAKPTTTPNPDQYAAITKQITDVMCQERFYANQSTTLADLATCLNVPVHRLREVINKSLGYRNFNQFLNHYRIQEASLRLRAESTLPILTIALDVGFKSLSSFNTAFRQTHGMTPTEWRRQD